jgi:hypothetical protein
MKHIIISMVCLLLLVTGTGAQEVTFDIISTTGSIVDKKSGKELQVGDRVTLQTELQFNSLNDRAVLLNPEKTKYFLELPKSSFVNSQLTVASSQALSPVKARPALITGVRGNSVLVTKGLSPQSLKEYFEIDTFTIVGAKFTLPVTRQDARKYNLLLRYEVGNIVEEYVSTDFTISRNDLKMQGNHISECYVLLKEGDKTIPVTQMSLFFVDKPQLFGEFQSLLKALNQTKNDKNKVREILRQYCTDVYGVIDRSILETTINDFLALK